MENMKDIISDEIRKQLREKFPDEAYKAHPTKTFLTTLKAMYVVERLNDVFGIGRWDLTNEVVERTNDYVLIKGQLIIMDYDCFIPAQYGGHTTVGKNTEIADGYKSAVTDCLSKSASYLEIGIDMFKGSIPPPTGTAKGNNSNKDKPKAKDGGLKTLTSAEVEKKWNGKIYSDKLVYIDNVKYEIPAEQIEKLKTHTKYKKD